MLVGDMRKYLTCLVTLKVWMWLAVCDVRCGAVRCVWLLFLQCVINLDTGEPTDDLLTEAKQALAELGCNFTTVSEVRTAEDEKVHKAIMDGLKRYNETQAISNAQKVLGLGRDSNWMSTTACFIVGFVRPSHLCHVFTMYQMPPRSRSTTCWSQTSQCPGESWVGALSTAN